MVKMKSNVVLNVVRNAVTEERLHAMQYDGPFRCLPFLMERDQNSCWNISDAFTTLPRDSTMSLSLTGLSLCKAIPITASKGQPFFFSSFFLGGGLLTCPHDSPRRQRQVLSVTSFPNIKTKSCLWYRICLEVGIGNTFARKPFGEPAMVHTNSVLLSSPKNKTRQACVALLFSHSLMDKEALFLSKEKL